MSAEPTAPTPAWEGDAEVPVHVPVWRYSEGVFTPTQDELAEEEPLEIRVRGRSISITMRTPGHDPELAVGFLLTEGVIRAASDILRVEPCTRNEAGNRVDVILSPDTHVDFERLTRHVFASSSCGLCGKASAEAVRGQFPPISDKGLRIVPQVLLQLPPAMRQAQAAFARTGGLHAAALFDPRGELVVLREDVGRHNAVDKVLGHALLKGLLPAEAPILLVSGRCSFEIVQKALAGRIPLIAAVSAPTHLAVQLAREAGMTLVGFVREGRMNVYTGPCRLII